jgi:hypothetical protein
MMPYRRKRQKWTNGKRDLVRSRVKLKDPGSTSMEVQGFAPP